MTRKQLKQLIRETIEEVGTAAAQGTIEDRINKLFQQNPKLAAKVNALDGNKALQGALGSSLKEGILDKMPVRLKKLIMISALAVGGLTSAQDIKAATPDESSSAKMERAVNTFLKIISEANALRNDVQPEVERLFAEKKPMEAAKLRDDTNAKILKMLGGDKNSTYYFLLQVI